MAFSSPMSRSLKTGNREPLGEAGGDSPREVGFKTSYYGHPNEKCINHQRSARGFLPYARNAREALHIKWSNAWTRAQPKNRSTRRLNKIIKMLFRTARSVLDCMSSASAERTAHTRTSGRLVLGFLLISGWCWGAKIDVRLFKNLDLQRCDRFSVAPLEETWLFFRQSPVLLR